MRMTSGDAPNLASLLSADLGAWPAERRELVEGLLSAVHETDPRTIDVARTLGPECEALIAGILGTHILGDTDAPGGGYALVHAANVAGGGEMNPADLRPLAHRVHCLLET